MCGKTNVNNRNEKEDPNIVIFLVTGDGINCLRNERTSTKDILTVTFPFNSNNLIKGGKFFTVDIKHFYL